MKSETIQVNLPKEILESAEEIGLSKDKIREMMKSFAILEVVASSGKLNEKEAERLSEKIKAKAWKKTKEKLKI